IFLPLRAVANALDLEVGWDGAQNIITVGAEPEDTDPDLNSFTVTLGETVYTVEMGELEYLGFEEFTAVDRGNERVFTGVKIADVLDSLGINPEAVESITLTAANGNTSTFPDEDPLNLDSDILAVAEGGVELTPWADGGSGPFRLVRTHHTIPQQWLSNIVDITVVLGDAPDVQAAPIVVTGVDRARRTVSAEDIMDIENVAITATIRGTERNFTGVPLVDVLRLSGANYRGAESLNLRAPDGFNVFLTIEETLDETNAFIAWLEDGEPVTSYAQTPFMLVVAQDTVPMRFIRNIAEITIAAPLETGETPELGMYEFAIEAGGQTYVASMELLEELGLVDFDSGGGRYFTGVAILDILAYFEIDHSDANGLRFVTMDGLTHEWTAEEAFTEGNGFVAVLENGEPLRERDYPFRSVLVGFASNRWMGQLHVITLL
ncbi:MAG: hypothetical protein FWB75_08085, partial [Oscillospiraceae bacterium]|nr:hypothetical protein [Oscillospiraceae bacterium]